MPLVPKAGPVHRGKLVDDVDDSGARKRVFGWAQKVECPSGVDANFKARLVDVVASDHLGPTLDFQVYGVLRECHKGPFESYEEAGCFPPTGASNVIDLYLCNANNCLSAHRQRVELTYGGGVWTGSVGLVNGTMTFELECGVPDPDHWRLTLGGCLPSPIVLDAEPEFCDGLLLLNYPDQEIEDCCSCEGGSDSGVVGLSIASRRPGNYAARYVDEAGGKRVFGYREECADHCSPVGCCDNVQCDLTVELTGCDGIAGTYVITPQPATFGYDQEWDLQTTAPCGDTLEIFLGCTEGPAGCGNFTLVIECNEYTSGTSTAVRECCDEDGVVDVTIPVTLVYHDEVPGATPCCDPPCSGAVSAHITL